MRKLILALLLISTPAAAQMPQQPRQPQTVPVIPQQPNGVIMTPQGNITRNGAYVMYPDGSSAIVNPNGLTTYSNGQGCRTTGNSTYCW